MSQLDMEGQRKFAELQMNTTKLDKKADELQAQQDEINAETKELELKIAQSEVKNIFFIKKRICDYVFTAKNRFIRSR